MKKKKSRRAFIKVGILSGAALIFAIFIYMGYSIWTDYKNQIIQGQKDQMLLTAKSIADGMEANLTSYEYDLDYLCEIQKNDFSTKEAWEGIASYVKVHKMFVYDVLLEDIKENQMRSVSGFTIKEVFSDSPINHETSIQFVALTNEEKYIAIRRKLSEVEYLSILLDGKKYYQSIMANVQMGSNGYVVIKDSDGVILMYPTDDQLGINVIEGRMELYPQADYTSLKSMIEKQKEGKQGVSEYYSYWWEKLKNQDEKSARVKKISAYVPAYLGESFLIVSTVIDYDDIYVPIAEGYMKLFLLFIAVLVIILFVLIYSGRLLIQRQKDTEKIEYLTDLNHILEEMQKSEENISHSQRLQIMGTMTGGIAHEFNNLLTPILGYADLLLLELEHQPEEHEQVQEIQEAALKAKDIIQQLSSMSRKNIETVFNKLSVLEVMQRSLKMVQSICPDNIKVVTKISDEEVYVLGNRTQISQVLLNITLNAVQAMGAEPGTICIHCDKIKWIESDELPSSELEFEKEYVKIEIEDTGPGMSEDIIKQIFTPFFTTKKGGAGTGLGLALVDQIIRSHKGSVVVNSEIGCGSTFTIYLPVVSEMYIEESRIQRRNSGEYVLVVDDNQKVLSMLTKNLAKVGITVLGADTYQKASEMLTDQIGIVILDQSISGQSAIPVAMSLKARFPNLIRLVAVDVVDREILEAKKREIIDDYLEKPLSDIEILRKARTAAQKR
ncbi:signal transduction histidine kinase/CheY-like chemotaxis protein [Aequitasia blattaphilus]|uniref:Stage 0 sporulation protein A homolog n=1 Tax=Aequitasia blattaphilus TaxID=2949332 RepID=A0ABT1E963_9FIRM|nr:ATP-binding protein [Aequitasia blattaphilus]MCP1102379.1 ATP-binding protein [Aequitasia blattaphilus]MCR8615019.1 ATP-binding protein [Aequitasia blattaphilus]